MKETPATKPQTHKQWDKQDAPFLDLRLCSSKFGFSASGVGGRHCEPGARHPRGAPADCGWTLRSPYLGAMEQKSLGEGFAYALRRARHQGHFAVHVHGGSRLCGWWASSGSGRRCSFYGPVGARVQRPRELSCQWAGMKLSNQRLGNRPSVTCPGAPGSAGGDLCLLGFQLSQIPQQGLLSSLRLCEDDELTEEKQNGRKTNFLKKFPELRKG